MERVPVYRCRLVRETTELVPDTQISSPGAIVSVAKAMLEDQDREVFLVLFLNARNRVNGAHVASMGDLDSSIVHPRAFGRAVPLAGRPRGHPDAEGGRQAPRDRAAGPRDHRQRRPPRLTEGKVPAVRKCLTYHSIYGSMQACVDGARGEPGSLTGDEETMTQIKKRMGRRPSVPEEQQMVGRSFTLPKPTLEWLQEEAQRRGITVSALVREAVDREQKASAP